MTKVLNIAKYLPLKGRLPENDITLKIYHDLKIMHSVDSIFIHPVAFIPKVATRIKKSTLASYKLVNNTNYRDETYGSQINFFQSYLPYSIPSKLILFSFYSQILQFFFFKQALYNQIEEFKPDLLHAHTLRDGFYAYRASKKMNIPFVVTLRGKYSKLYSLPIVHKILQTSAKLFTPSFELKKKLKIDYRVELLPHGLEKEWFNATSKSWSNGVLRIVTVSRLLEIKNIPMILKSLSKLKKLQIKFKFDIVGDGPIREDLERQVNELKLSDDVRFLGFLSADEIRSVYLDNEIFIMLSPRETFGRVYFEAAAQGLLVIAVKGTGADGYLTELDCFLTEPSMTEIVQILSNCNEKDFYSKTKNSLIKVRSMNNEKIIRKYYELLNETIEKKNLINID